MNYSSKVYYKVRWQLLQSATAFFITKCDSYFITKCGKCYYKVWQVLQSATILLQSATGITKCDDYYKVRQNKPWHQNKNGVTNAKKETGRLSGLDYLITADFYGLFRFTLLVHKTYCYFSSDLVFLVAFILYFRGTKTRESRLFRPFSLCF